MSGLKRNENKDNNNVNDAATETRSDQRGRTREERNEERRDRRRDRDEERRRDREEERNRYREDEERPLNFFNDAGIASIGTGGNELSSFLTVSKEFMKNAAVSMKKDREWSWELLPASSEETRFKCDAAILTHHDPKLNLTLVTTIIFAPRSALPRQSADGDRRKETYAAVPADQWNEIYREEIRRIVKGNVVNPGEIVLIGAITVPNTYTISDKDDAGKRNIIDALRAFSTNSAYRMVDMDPERGGLVINDELIDEVDLVAMVEYYAGDTQDLFGQPIRSDIQVSIHAERYRDRRRGRGRGRDYDRDVRENSLHANDDMHIGKLTGYADLAYLSPDDRRGNDRRRSRSRDRDLIESRIYSSNLHITRMDSGNRTTLDAQILMMAQLPMLIDEGVISRALNPTGDMAYLRNPASLILDQDPDFREIPENPTREEWEVITDAIICPGTTEVFLHINEAGLMTGVQETLIKAAGRRRNDDTKDAIDTLNATASAVTGGIFDDKFDCAFGEIDTRQMLLGHFVDINGKVRDPRELQDYMSVLTFYGKGDNFKQALSDYEAACYDDSLDDDVRLSMLESIIHEMSDNTLVITDRATVINVNPEWIYELADCCEEAGLTVKTSGLSEDTRSRRGGGYRNTFGSDTYRGDLYRRDSGRRGGRRR